MKRTTILLVLLFFLIQLNAQSPLAIPYQAVARNASGNLISNQQISIRFSIHDGTAGGTVVYQEKHQVTTSNLGLFNVTIGTGTILSGNMSTIDWAHEKKFIQVELDPSGGNNYIDMGTTQMMSVPFALHAKTVEQNLGKTHVILSGEISDAEAAQILSTNGGLNTQFVKIIGTTQLTTVNLDMFPELINIEIVGNESLQNLTAPSLTRLYGAIKITDNPLLTNIAFPSLTHIFSGANGNEIANNTELLNISFDNLQKLDGALGIRNNNKLASVMLSQLQKISKDFYIQNGMLTTLNLPNLQSAQSFGLYDLPLLHLDLSGLNFLNQNNNYTFLEIWKTNLTSLNLSGLTDFPKSLYLSENPFLEAVNLPAITSVKSQSWFNLTKNKFSTSGINYLLSKFSAALPYTNSSINLEMQNPPAPPSGQGIIDKNTIIAATNTVITD